DRADRARRVGSSIRFLGTPTPTFLVRMFPETALWSRAFETPRNSSGRKFALVAWRGGTRPSVRTSAAARGRSIRGKTGRTGCRPETTGPRSFRAAFASGSVRRRADVARHQKRQANRGRRGADIVVKGRADLEERIAGGDRDEGNREGRQRLAGKRPRKQQPARHPVD